MDKLKLKAKTRDVIGKKVKSLRREGQIPVILYSPEIKKSKSLVVNYKDFEKVYNQAGESTIIELTIDEKDKKNVLIKDVQLDPLTTDYYHVDFYLVKMTEEITANIELNFIGVSLAVKDKGGILVKKMDEIEVKCLPGDLIKEIKVDISSLRTFDNVIKIKDLAIPSKVKVSAEQEEIVVTVAPPRSDEELKALDEKVEEKVDEVEGVKKEEEKLEATETEAAAKPEKKEGARQEKKEKKEEKK